MTFNSFEFLIFLPLVLVLYFSLKHRFRMLLLLAASLYFYMSWNPAFIILILVQMMIDFSAGLALSRLEKPAYRRLVLLLSIGSNLSLLLFFKYINFGIENLNFFISLLHPSAAPISPLNIILPVGISFYTFQSMSYTLDVYNKHIHTEKDPVTFATYVCYFPQLVAGPIERYGTLTPQLKKEAHFSISNLSNGMRLILYGLFLKMVIADNVGIIVNDTYKDIANTSQLNLIIAAILYSFQIYCDFNGYTTIAIGTAKIFDVDLTKNFRSPYLSTSITDFWRRWHITLTTWFRDYIYYPMGGNRGTRARWLLAILTVFIVSGIWHGASWTFIIWGLANAILLIFEKLLKYDKQSRFFPVNLIKGIITFSIVTLLWIVFRSPDIKSALLYFTSIIHTNGIVFKPISAELIVIIAIFIILDVLTRKSDFSGWIGNKNFFARWSIYIVLMFFILARSGTDMNPFIYFQF